MGHAITPTAGIKRATAAPAPLTRATQVVAVLESGGRMCTGPRGLYLHDGHGNQIPAWRNALKSAAAHWARVSP